MGYLPRPWVTDWASHSYGSQVCQLLKALYAVDPLTEVQRLWAQFGWDKGQFTLFVDTANVPRAFGVETKDVIWVGVSGTDKLRQVLLYANPGAVYGGDLFGPVHNATFHGWGRRVADQVVFADPNAKKALLLNGHSYGAAVVVAAGNQLAGSYGRSRMLVTTFGCPKVGTPSYYDYMDQQLAVNWMNEGDPVPALPPSQGELGVPLPFLRQLVGRLLFFGYSHLPYARLVDDRGQVVGYRPSSLTPSLFRLLLLDADASAAFNPNRFHWHTLDAYQERMELLVWLDQARSVGAVPGTPGFTQALRSFYDARRNALLIARRGDAGTGGSMSVAPYVPTYYLTHAEKRGPNWACAFRFGGDIATFATRSQAHSCSKALNKFLRRLQLASAFNQPGAEAAFAQYLAFASAGTNGFRPPALPGGIG